MPLDADTLKRLATMSQGDATALLSGIQDLQSIDVGALQAQSADLFTLQDATGANPNVRALTQAVADSGNQVTGYQRVLTPDLEGAADVKGRARFVGNYDTSGKLTGIERQDVGLSNGFLSDHLETIGPIAVALAAIAGGMPIDPSLAAGAGNAPAAAAPTAAAPVGAGAETGAAIAGIDQVAPVAATGGGTGAGSAAAAGGSTAAAPSLVDRVLASPIAQQAAGAVLATTIVNQTARTPSPTIETAAPAPTPSAAGTQPELAPISQALGNKYDTPVSTFLTGPNGVDPAKLRLGRNVLLGA